MMQAFLQFVGAEKREKIKQPLETIPTKTGYAILPSTFDEFLFFSSRCEIIFFKIGDTLPVVSPAPLSQSLKTH